MKVMKNLALLAVATLFMAGCGTAKGDSRSDGEYVFNVASVLSAEDSVSLGLDKFADIVAEKSEGKIKVETFHGGQLGSDLETFEAVKNGNLDMATGSIANISPITNAFNVLHLPFLFDSKEQAFNIVNNEQVRGSIDQDLAQINLKWFGAFDSGGPRVIATKNKEVHSLEDLKGMKLRASESPLELAAHKALGAKGTSISWPETPQAISQGMVDGVTVPLNALHPSKLYEDGTIKSVAYIPFQWFFHATVINKDKWESLPKDVQEILSESIKEAEKWQLDNVDQLYTGIVKDMKDAGLQINKLPETEYKKIEKVTKDVVWDKYVDGKTVTQEKLDLILDELIESKQAGDWGYQIE
ncbi:TRAP transporter substrate-binding protein [Mammaliicoccus sciuri]|uniref:Tripartite ATP-independent transporter solute receptor, DctP family n=1 Tax=Sporosarcina newyorkensis TaxID=759851 RepID=A0A1T4Y047_9BACL|nr:TRAP transporter substrate-binding protein [Sporosarcina newyorkensis]SKA94828.1 tripartite ATP-independent transporter solute receptor, DctP family [Sporosarcina newyorkensis]